jgi:hypothetical protein
MAQPDLATRLNDAISLINAGRRADARAILLDLSQQYPQSEAVLLWLAAVTDDTDERIAHLRRVLQINPRNEKARTAFMQLTGQAPPMPEPLPPAPPEPSSTRSIETLLIGILSLALVIGAIVLVTAVVSNLLNPRPTPTRPPTLTLTRAPTLTRTPSYTPGGPTITFKVVNTLPPTWTLEPSNTPLPTRQLAASLTPLPTFTPSTTPIPKPSWTALPTFTPGGPGLSTRTPTPTVTPTGTLSPQPSSSVTATGSTTVTATPTGSGTPTASGGF